jgi:hypothetical protein
MVVRLHGKFLMRGAGKLNGVLAGNCPNLVEKDRFWRENLTDFNKKIKRKKAGKFRKSHLDQKNLLW